MKAYVKPELYYENFELSQHIAACAWDMTDFRTKEDCSAVGDSSMGITGVALFTKSSVCADVISPDVAESYCYEVESDAFNIFNS